MISHEKQCKICKYGEDKIDWGLSNKAISRVVDCADKSVARHKIWAEKNGFDLSLPAYEGQADDQNRPDWVAKSGVPSRAWQTGSGKWRESFQNAASEEPEEYDWDYSSIIDSLADFEYTPGQDMTGKPEAFIWADPQTGKTDRRGGGTKETVARSLTARDRFIDRIKVSKPEVVYFVDLGDPIENCFSTGSQVGTNDLSVPDQVLLYERLTVEMLKSILPYAGRIVHVAVTSNHGEARNATGNNPYGSENDWGLHMQQVVKDRFSERPDLPVTFARPDHEEDTAIIAMDDGTIVAFTHGHHAGSPKNVKAWVERQVIGERPGHDAHVWVVGHFHHAYSYSFGKGKMIFGAPSCDPGSAWVTRKNGEEAEPGVLALTFADKGWSNYSIL